MGKLLLKNLESQKYNKQILQTQPRLTAQRLHLNTPLL